MQHSPLRIRGLLFPLVMLAFCLGAGLACPGNLDPYFLSQGAAGMNGAAGMGAGGSTPGSFPACETLGIEPTQLMKNKCGMASCHTPGNTNAGGLDLSTMDGVAARLVGQMSTDENGGLCGGMTYLVAGSTPATGLLMDKLIAENCGAKMPNLGAWNQTNTDCIQQWANSVTAP